MWTQCTGVNAKGTLIPYSTMLLRLCLPILLTLLEHISAQGSEELGETLRAELNNYGVVCTSEDTLGLVNQCGLTFVLQPTLLSACPPCGGVDAAIGCLNRVPVTMICAQGVKSKLNILPLVLRQLLSVGDECPQLTTASSITELCPDVIHLEVPAWVDTGTSTECDVTCGGGSQLMSRKCVDMGTEDELIGRCDGNTQYSVECNTEDCGTSGEASTGESMTDVTTYFPEANSTLRRVEDTTAVKTSVSTQPTTLRATPPVSMATRPYDGTALPLVVNAFSIKLYLAYNYMI